MKKKFYFTDKKPILWLCAIVGMLCMVSCTKNFEKYNTNPSEPTAAQLAGDYQNVGSFFPDMETSVMRTVDWEYQVQQNLNADVFSGYMMSADPFLGNQNNLNYEMVPSWNFYTFDEEYQHVMGAWQQIKLQAKQQFPHFYAIATIIKVEAMHRVTDTYGPIPYSKFGTVAFNVPYDSQQDVYNEMFKDLDTAVSALTTYVKANPGAKPFQKFDLIYGGDYTQWIKFANLLRLRLAMHIVYADPETAKTQAEEAVANSYGLPSTVADDALVNMTNGITYQNPMWIITTSWGDISGGAPVESILKGYNDTRLPKYFLPSTSPANDYKGIRNGINITSGGQYAGFSELAIGANTPLQWMVASESFFLRAEGALRGWNMGSGTAQSFYEAGIQLSFQEKGATMPSGYLTDNTGTAVPYVDPNNANNNVPAGSAYLNKITIAWNDGDTFEHNLQRIITQKWIAMFPDGMEAWTEYRRTGYPVLFPVVINNSGGTIPSVPGIRRLPFPSDEVSNNTAQVQKAIQLLGGPDNGGTKLWWDKNPNH